MTPRQPKNVTHAAALRMSRLQRENLIRLRRKQARIREANRRLDAARLKTGSDWKTAQQLHITPQRLCDIRKGRRPMTTEAAVRLARLLGEHPFSALSRTLADRSFSRTTRRFWLMVGIGQWPFVPDSYYDWANRPSRKKYSLGGY